VSHGSRISIERFTMSSQANRPPIQLNRRKFLGCSAAAGLALAHPPSAGASADPSGCVVRLGLVGAGNRGTTLLRTLLELPGATINAVCDPDPKHLARARGIVAKVQGNAPATFEDPSGLMDRDDLDALVVATPCDQHAPTALAALAAGKALYLEKPLAPTLAESDAILEAARRRPEVVVRVGFQRRSHPRFRELAHLVRRGELDELLEVRAAWISSNGPINGHDDWLAQRARSGDWMVEQAVHIWDVLHWLLQGPPSRAVGFGRRDVFASRSAGRDVTDQYSALLEWPTGVHASFTQSWVDPADDAFTGTSLKLVGTAGGADFSTGTITYRDRTRPRRVVHPGNLPDTRLALEEFLAAVRAPDSSSVVPPLTLDEARVATQIGLLVRRAVDERRIVALDEIDSPGATV
jgi:myo-inositol 2-dehydrogenase/D-chiro-inositol 1-dehydrogenase